MRETKVEFWKNKNVHPQVQYYYYLINQLISKIVPNTITKGPTNEIGLEIASQNNFLDVRSIGIILRRIKKQISIFKHGFF